MMVNKKILVDDALECLLMPSDPAHDSLYASMQYSLMAGGKTDTPLFIFGTSRYIGCGFEFIYKCGLRIGMCSYIFTHS